MLSREKKIAVCSEIHTKHINTVCEQNVELLNVNPGGTHNSHRAVNHTFILTLTNLVAIRQIRTSLKQESFEVGMGGLAASRTVVITKT